MKSLSSRIKNNKRTKNMENIFPGFKSNLTIQSYINQRLNKLKKETNKKHHVCKSLNLTVRNSNIIYENKTQKIKKINKNNYNSNSNNISENNISKDKIINNNSNFFINENNNSKFIFPFEKKDEKIIEKEIDDNEIEIEMLRDENFKLRNELNESKNTILKLENMIKNLMIDYPISKEKCPIPMPAVIKLYDKNKNIKYKKIKSKVNNKSKNKSQIDFNINEKNISNYNSNKNPYFISINELILN